MPAPIFSSLTPLVAKNSLAPSFIASAFLDSVCEKTTTYVAAHLGCELDRQMPQAADADDADVVGGLAAELCKGVEDCCAAAH